MARSTTLDSERAHGSDTAGEQVDAVQGRRAVGGIERRQGSDADGGSVAELAVDVEADGAGGVDAELAGRAERAGVGGGLDDDVVVGGVDVEQRGGGARVGVVVGVGHRGHAEPG